MKKIIYKSIKELEEAKFYHDDIENYDMMLDNQE